MGTLCTPQRTAPIRFVCSVFNLRKMSHASSFMSLFGTPIFLMQK
ncbi:hypothetical protein CEV31_3428 [Brucella thiophenivorans]|uniref:Uncharacterized protein n=1 Tax=Brucella thiophenivorans TaxID=571255 RepID=A0A256FG50_9HYPH|nr:hypothetical protein CEV31_3428 [Brucella thiophenivorans]